MDNITNLYELAEFLAQTYIDFYQTDESSSYRYGFFVRFPDKTKVSVQFGPGAYSDNYELFFNKEWSWADYARNTATAEVAIFLPNGAWYIPDPAYEGQTFVYEHQTIEEVIALIKLAETF